MFTYYLTIFIDYLFQILNILLLIRVIISWVPHDMYHPIIQLLYTITDPILKPFQNLIPAHKIGVDFSPIIAFMVLGLVKSVLLKILVFGGF